MANPKTLSEALCEIYKLRGVADLQDPAKLSALFVDIAPNLKAERTQLEILIKSGCLKKLAATAEVSATERKPVIDASVVTLSNDYLMDPKKAEALCRAYAYALKGKPFPPKGSTPSGGTNGGNKPSGGNKPNGGNKPSGGTNGGNSSGSGKAHGSGFTGPGPINYGGSKPNIKDMFDGDKVNGGGNKAGGTPNGGNKAGGTPNGGNKAGSNAPITTQKPSGCGTGLIIFFVLAIAFGITYGISVGSGMETPEANAAIVTVIVAFVAWAITKSKKKK